ncbi:MAG TPA: competence protein CoiA family protein [Candidatus Limnocylindria bacterium]|jgi:hypothetical protein|nr:competence protein CoiA family protein [Candidatus Limnocylindria bacterium]
MQYAIVDGKKSEPMKGIKGRCPMCGAEMVAKCGSRVIHHWAHAYRQNCDPWWENETAWHREWKSHFPIHCREIAHAAPSGEIHRADVKTSTGIIIEFQHSSMTDVERVSREQFYQNLVWIIDGSEFKDDFDIYHLLPDPKSELAKDIVWHKATRKMQGAARGLFHRHSDINTFGFHIYHGIGEIEEEVNRSYRGHHQYHWVRPRQTWLDATCPVYIDFGNDTLVRLEKYDTYKLPCIFLVDKQKFLNDAITETLGISIATRYYPLPV